MTAGDAIAAVVLLGTMVVTALLWRAVALGDARAWRVSRMGRFHASDAVLNHDALRKAFGLPVDLDDSPEAVWGPQL